MKDENGDPWSPSKQKAKEKMMAKEALKKMINVDEFDEFEKELENEIYGDISVAAIDPDDDDPNAASMNSNPNLNSAFRRRATFEGDLPGKNKNLTAAVLALN